MIKVGFNVLAWTAEVSEKLFPIADQLKQIGYDGSNVLLVQVTRQLIDSLEITHVHWAWKQLP